MEKIDTNLARFQIVDAQNLEYQTSRGWKLVGVFETQEIEMQNEPVPLEGQGNDFKNSYYNSPRTWQKPYLVTKLKFLVALDENSAVARLATELQDAIFATQKLEKDIAKIRKAVGEPKMKEILAG